MIEEKLVKNCLVNKFFIRYFFLFCRFDDVNNIFEDFFSFRYVSILKGGILKLLKLSIGLGNFLK